MFGMKRTQRKLDRMREDITALHKRIMVLEGELIYRRVYSREALMPYLPYNDVSLRQAVDDIAQHLGLKYEYSFGEPARGQPVFIDSVNVPEENQPQEDTE